MYWKTFLINTKDNYRLFERKDENGIYIYEVYSKDNISKKCLLHLESVDEDLNSMTKSELKNSTIYARFLNFIEKEKDNYDDLNFNLEEKVDEKEVKKLSKSDTIVFHLKDNSTTMLNQIYQNKGYDIVNYRLNTPTLKTLLDKHKRVICLGHGTSHGLLGMFGPEIKNHLKDKKLFIIWCNADKYFNNNLGKGYFITGNMPSEVGECRYAGCGNISHSLMLENITYWSKLCSDVVEDCLNGKIRESLNYIRTEYIKKYGDHPVTHYNAVRTKIQGDSYDQAEKEVTEIENKLNIHPDWYKYNKNKKEEEGDLNMLKEENESKICCICGKNFNDYGNNAEPVKKGICCDECNYSKVIPERIKNLKVEGMKSNEENEVESSIWIISEDTLGLKSGEKEINLKFFLDEDKFRYIVSNGCEGDLTDFINSRKVLEDDEEVIYPDNKVLRELSFDEQKEKDKISMILTFKNDDVEFFDIYFDEKNKENLVIEKIPNKEKDISFSFIINNIFTSCKKNNEEVKEEKDIIKENKSNYNFVSISKDDEFYEEID